MIMPLFGRNKTSFQRDAKEIFVRSWWLANKVCAAAVSQYPPTAPSSLIDDERFHEQYKQILSEIIGYTISFVLNRLRDDIEKHHGWTDATYDMNIRYQVSIGMAFDKVFGVRGPGEGVFIDLFQEYYTPDYEHGYEQYWRIPHEVTDPDMDTTLEELLQDIRNDPKADEYYNVDRLYTYRLSKIVNVVDRDKVISNAQSLYRGIALSFYDEAFFSLSLKRIKKELKAMVNE